MTGIRATRVVLLGMAFAAGAPAEAQTLPDTLDIRAAVVSTFDSNMLRLSEERAPNDRSDVRLTPQLDITVRRLIGGRHQLTIGGTAGYEFHDRFRFLDRERIDLGGDINVAVGAFCHVRPGVRLNWGQAQLSDQGVILGNTERRTDYEIALACPNPGGLYPTAAGRITRVTNSADRRRIFNLNNDFIELGAGYSLPSVGELLLMASYERFDRPVLRDVADMDARTNTYRAGVEFRRAVAPRISFRAAAYYLRVDPDEPTWPTFGGLGFRGGVNFHPAPALEADLQLSRDVVNQSNTGTAFTIQTEARFSASYRPSPRTQLRVGGRYLRRALRGQIIVDTPFPRERDSTYGLFAGYTVDINERLRAGLMARHERRDAPLTYYEFSTTSGAATLSVRF
jgi:hypothetical protein